MRRQTADWASLPDALVELVLLGLPPQDRQSAAKVCTQWERAAARTHTTMRLDLPLPPDADPGELLAAFERRRGQLTAQEFTLTGISDLPWAGYFAGRAPALQRLAVRALLGDYYGEDEDELDLPCLPWPQWLPRLAPQLRDLTLSGLRSLPPNIRQMTALTPLVLEEPGAYGYGLPAAITALTQLQELDVSLNNFASPRWQDEEEGEEDQEEGEEDQEEWNGWEDSAATASLRRLHHMPALRSLCLGGCTLTSLTWLQVCTQLTNLELNSDVDYPGHITSLQHLTQLARLKLGMYRPPAVVAQLPLLRTLLLSVSCRTYQDNGLHVPAGPYPALHELSIKCPGLRELPPQLSCMQQLETLRVSTAGTLQLSSRQLPALLRKLPCLTRLELGGHPGNLKPGLERAAAKLPQLQLELA